MPTIFFCWFCQLVVYISNISDEHLVFIIRFEMCRLRMKSGGG